VRRLCECKRELPLSTADAARHGIFLYKETMMTYDVFEDYDLQLEHAGMTLDRFVTIRASDYSNRDAKPEFPSKPTFNAMYWEWTAACYLARDDLFTCPICDRLPMSERQFVFDGTHIGLKRSNLSISPLAGCAEAADRKNKPG
jgi:hypothetical protein